MAETFDVIATRDLPVAPERAWLSWTDPRYVRQWWGPEGFTCTLAELDVRVGGTSRVAMSAPQWGFDAMYSTWDYTLVEPPHRLEFLHTNVDENGVTMEIPGVPPSVSHEITFEALGPELTRMTVTEYGYPDADTRDLSQRGLEECLDKLVRLFPNTAPSAEAASGPRLAFVAGTIGRMLRERRAGERKSAWFRPGLEGADVIRVTSPAFADGEPMPTRHAGPGVGQNVSPALAWTGVPEGAAELVLIVEDPDAPLRRPFVHVALAGIPATVSGFDEGALNRDQRPYGTGRGGFGRPGYTGPRPVAGHGPHHYLFQLFAVDVPLELPVGATPAAIFEALETHVIGRGRLVGTYER